MNSEKYIGLDVHQATISVAVKCGSGVPARALANINSTLMAAPILP